MGKSVPETRGSLSLFHLTWPLLIELFLQILIGSTDTFMLSHISDEAVAAVGVANQLVFFLIILLGMIGAGTAVVLSQYLGARMEREASRTAAGAITINLIFGLFLSLIVLGFRGTFLDLFDITDQVREYADIYLAFVGGTIFTQAGIVTISAILRSNGYTKDAMFASIAMNLIHIFLNYIAIYGAWGFPQLGVTGVGISTMISRALAMALLFVLMYRRIASCPRLQDYFRIHWEHVKKVLHIGVPTAAEQLSYNTSQITITAFIATIGTVALSTRVYTLNIMMYMMLFGMAVGQSTQIMVGHLVGAGKKEEAYRIMLRNLGISFVVTILSSAAVVYFRTSLLSIFTDDRQIISIGGTLLLICLILEPGRTFNIVVISSLRAAGDAKFPVYMAVFSMWGISVPVAYFLAVHQSWGLPGVWVAFALDEWFRGIAMYIRWKSRAWERKSLVNPVASEAVAETV